MKPLKLTILFVVFFLVFPAMPLLADNSDRELVFGFLPSRSPVTLFNHYQPLVNYVSKQMNRKILVETAADYHEFVERTSKRQYDFVLTAPHFALLAIDSGKYEAPITYTQGLIADVLVHKDSNMTQIKQLAGKTIAIPPESAIISMVGKYYIQQQGFAKSRKPRFKITNSHNDSLHAMLSGEVDAAIVSYNITRQFKEKNFPLKKIGNSSKLPGMGILVARNLPDNIRQSFSRALIEMKSRQDGQKALKQMGYTGYRLARQNEFEAARPYIRMYMESSNRLNSK